MLVSLCSRPSGILGLAVRPASGSAHTVYAAAQGAGLNAMALLEVTAVTQVFGQLRALDGVDLTVRAGTFHGLIGPNGSGKSTLLKAIAGAHAPTSGTIRFDGMDIAARRPSSARAPDSASNSRSPPCCLNSRSTTTCCSRFNRARGCPSLLRSRTRRVLDGDVMTALDRFRLAGRANDLAGEFSHGQQQWLEIAMALACGRSCCCSTSRLGNEPGGAPGNR